MELAGHQKYRLGEMLGAGGMAEVYRAELCGAEGFSRPIAIKRVLREQSQNQLFAEMFINEARISSLLSHPNVVSVIDFDRDAEGCLFLVMELVPGKDLNQLTKGGGLLPLPVVIHLTCEILRGLGYAHDRVHAGKHLGIVHRDVSPHNVLVSWDGAVKVSDFGIAKAAAATDATRSGMLKGKVAYMSPEQAHQVPLDGRSDLFAVGIMLYQMLVGSSPFEGGSIGEVLAHILVQNPRPPRELRPDLPADIEAITMRLLEKDRDRRFPSAREAVTALLGCAAASPRAADELVALLRERYPDEAPPLPTRASAAATTLETPMVLGAGAEGLARSGHAWSQAAPNPPRGPTGGTMPLPASIKPHAPGAPASLQVTPTPTAAGQAAPARPAPTARPQSAGRRVVVAAVVVAAVVAVVAFTLLVTLDGGDSKPTAATDLPSAAAAPAPAPADAGLEPTPMARDAGPPEPIATDEAPPIDAALAPLPAVGTKHPTRPKHGRSRTRDKKSPGDGKEPVRPSPRDWDVPIGHQDPARVPVKKGTP